METSSQLHHDLILPSDEGADQSLGDMEGLLSSRHKQLLLKVRTVCSVCSVSPCAAVPCQEGELQVHAGRGRQRQGHRGRAAPPAGGEREDTEEAPVWEVHPVTQSGQAESLGWATSRHVTSRHVTSRHEILPCQLIISMIELAKEILFIWFMI